MEEKFYLGLAILIVGIALLLFTFWQAFLLLGEMSPQEFRQIFSQASSKSLESVVEVAVSLLVYVALRVTYLGIMAWVGSLVSMRGVQILVSKTPE